MLQVVRTRSAGKENMVLPDQIGRKTEGDTRFGQIARLQRKIQILRCLALGEQRKTQEGMPLRACAWAILRETGEGKLTSKDLGVDLAEVCEVYATETLREIEEALEPFRATQNLTKDERVAVEGLDAKVQELFEMALPEFLRKQIRTARDRISSLL